MPMHLDERADYLVRPIPESSDLPNFLCHFLCSSDSPAKQLRNSSLGGYLSLATNRCTTLLRRTNQKQTDLLRRLLCVDISRWVRHPYGARLTRVVRSECGLGVNVHRRTAQLGVTLPPAQRRTRARVTARRSVAWVHFVTCLILPAHVARASLGT